MTYTTFIMLAKTEVIERPIGLMSTLLKLGMKARWGLIEQWLSEYRDHLWWVAHCRSGLVRTTPR